jgi:chromosomal replication initiation ATPase DnaA
MPQSIVVTEPPRNYRREILSDAALEFGVSIEEIIQGKRSGHLAAPRQKVMARLWDERDYSLEQIGRVFGLDRSTVWQGIRRHYERTSRPPANDNTR